MPVCTGRKRGEVVLCQHVKNFFKIRQKTYERSDSSAPMQTQCLFFDADKLAKVVALAAQEQGRGALFWCGSAFEGQAGMAPTGGMPAWKRNAWILSTNMEA